MRAGRMRRPASRCWVVARRSGSCATVASHGGMLRSTCGKRAARPRPRSCEFKFGESAIRGLVYDFVYAARLLSRECLSDWNPTAALEALDLKLVDHAIVNGCCRYCDARKQHRHAKVVQMRRDVEHVLPGQRRSRLFEDMRGQKGSDIAVDDATVARVAL